MQPFFYMHSRGIIPKKEGGVQMICAFSGHRPQRLPWNTSEDDPRCVALKEKMEIGLKELTECQVNLFLCGMARGCDFYFAEAVLRLQKTVPSVQLWAILPCGNQTLGWCREDQARYGRILDGCTRVILLQKRYTSDCMRRRNQWLVEHADCLMTVYDGGSGGTGWTVRFAQRRKLPIIPLWL